MSTSRKYLIRSISALMVFTIIAVAVFLCIISSETQEQMSPQRQQNPFYRSPEELVMDGVKIITLTKGQEEIVHERIREFYSTTYREEYRSVHVQELESVDSAEVRVWSYSRPRSYEGLRDIVGIFASGGLYDEERGSLGKSARLFFFTVDGNTVNLEKALPVGEDVETYEKAPIASFKESALIK